MHSKLNTALVESFGELEKLCNQIYGSHHGVTNYIDDMNSLSDSGKANVQNWDYCLKRLKNVRYKRNRLSHGDVSFDDPCAEKDDINFLINLKNSILQQTDPLALYRKTKSAPPKLKRKKRQPTHSTQGNSSATLAICIFLALAIIFAVILWFNSHSI